LVGAVGIDSLEFLIGTLHWKIIWNPVYYNFTDRVFLRRWQTSFSQILNQALEQGKLMVDVNSRKKRSKIARSDVHNRLKFAKISSKDLLYMKMQKNGFREFDFSGTFILKLEGIFQGVIQWIHLNLKHTLIVSLQQLFFFNKYSIVSWICRKQVRRIQR